MRFFDLFTFSAVFVVATTQIGLSNGIKVVCPVYTQYELYIRNLSLDLNTVDWNLCTHIITVTDKVEVDPWNSLNEWQEQNYKQLTDFRQKYPHLKISLGVHLNPPIYFDIAASPSYQQNIIKTSRNFLLKHKFDGMHLQLENIGPRVNSIKPEPFKNVVLFMAALKEEFDQSKLLLSTTVVMPKRLDYGKYDLVALSKSVDFINVVYEYTWFLKGINDAMKWIQLLNTQDRIEKLIETGVSPAKVVLGLQMTGIGFCCGNGTLDRIYRYYEACSAENKTFHDESGLSILTKKDVDVVIEDSRSIANKVRFAVKRGLAGVAPIYMPFDDYSGVCSKDDDTFADFKPEEGVSLNIPKRIDHTFPLLRTINEAINVTLDEMEQEENLSESVTMSRAPFAVIAPVMTPSPIKFTNKDKKTKATIATYTTILNTEEPPSDLETMQPASSVLESGESASVLVLGESLTPNPTEGANRAAPNNINNLFSMAFVLFGTFVSFSTFTQL